MIEIYRCDSINTVNPKKHNRIETYRFLFRKDATVWDEDTFSPCWRLTMLGFGICITLKWDR